MLDKFRRFYNGPLGRRWLCYAAISFVAFSYGAINNVVLGRSQEQVERECLTLIAVLLILGPILFLSKPERDSVQQARVKWQSDMRLLSIVDLVQAENRAVERTSFFDILSPEVELSKMGLAEAFLAKHTRETHAPPVFGDSRNG